MGDLSDLGDLLGNLGDGDHSIDLSGFDFSQIGDGRGDGEGEEPGLGSTDFDFSEFFSEISTTGLFGDRQGDGGQDDGSPGIPNLGDLAGALGSFQDYTGGLHDLVEAGGDIGSLGGFFARSDDAVAAGRTATGLSLEDLGVLGGDFANDLLEDMDFFSFQATDGELLEHLLTSANDSRSTGLGLDGQQWAGALIRVDSDFLLGQDSEFYDSALDSMDHSAYGLLTSEAAQSLFQASLLGSGDGADGSFAERLASHGDDALNLLGVSDHDFYTQIGDELSALFESTDFSTLDLGNSTLEGDDIGGIIAGLGDARSEADLGNLTAALNLMDAVDFSDWTGAVADDVIGSLGLDTVLGMDQRDGIIGSYQADDVAGLADNLGDLIDAVDLDLHGDLLSGFSTGALNVLTTDQLNSYGDSAELVGLVNSAGISGVTEVLEDHLGALLGSLLDTGRSALDLVETATFGALVGRLSDDTLGGYDEDSQGAILGSLGADLLGGWGSDFGEIAGSMTSFALLADSDNSLGVDFDGDSSLDTGALGAFAALLFTGSE